ncbi:MAG: GSCFA domain-containing protein [Bacteroidota bacterium]
MKLLFDMVNFRTEITPDPPGIDITHGDKLMAMGSCFVENIGALLMGYKFNLLLNPFGVLYNPLSIAQSIHHLLEEKKVTEEDLFSINNLWSNYAFHSRFSSPIKSEALEKMQETTVAAARRIREADILIITFGTAWVYRLKDTKTVVANCHKVPAKAFHHQLATSNEIVVAMKEALGKLRSVNPGIKFIFTVSPIRHWKDGPVNNQLSKSTLFVALHYLLSEMDNVYYFPSYEIMLDDLRDYRFYEADMIHPNEQAIDYIWQKFSHVFFNSNTQSLMKEVQKIRQAASHRPFNPNTEVHQAFLRNQLQKIKNLQNEYGNLDFSHEVGVFKEHLR